MSHLTYIDKEYHMTKVFNYSFDSKTASLRSCYILYLYN